MNYDKILRKKIVGIVGSVSSGKTTTMLDMLDYTLEKYDTNVVCYFYHSEYKDRYADKVAFVNLIDELENVHDSFIFIDEFLELFMLNDRHSIEMVKRVLFQIEHNNNILVLAGLPEYFKKFVSSFVRCWVLHRLNFSELINGSALKKYVNALSGDFVGGTMLNLNAGQFFSMNRLHQVVIKGLFDKKAENIDLFTPKVKAKVYKEKSINNIMPKEATN